MKTTGKIRPQRAVSPEARKSPPRLQVGALCWRRSQKGLRIALITSRDTGRWVIPKGWPMRNRTDSEAARREAWEEAGLKGAISERSIGVYTYLKTFDGRAPIHCVVKVFPMKVQSMLKEYPENAERRQKWFSPKKAARRVAEPELAALIRQFGASNG